MKANTGKPILDALINASESLAEPEPCENCNGYGEVISGDPDIGQEERGEQCGQCEGTGKRHLPRPRILSDIEAEVTTPLPEGRL